MKAVLLTILLLVISNCFMTYAWYGHLKNLSHQVWFLAAVVSWGVAFFEYMFQVPANRIGATALTLPQLKIMQEAIALVVFVPFVVLYMKQPLSWNYLWASLCIVGAIFFVFRG
ncbi:MAG: DMT family protein [Planctomycetia bacterium]|nr:DMT family protein [Planctomycetia bacterium]